jgi:hypothetical protein
MQIQSFHEEFIPNVVPSGRLKISRDTILDNFQPSLRDSIMCVMHPGLRPGLSSAVPSRLVPIRCDCLFFGWELLAVQEGLLLGPRSSFPSHVRWREHEAPVRLPPTLGRPAHAFAEQILNQPYKAGGVEWLEAENHIQPVVGGLGIGKAAQHDHG